MKNKTSYEAVDLFELMTEEEEETPQQERIPADEALFSSLDAFGGVNMEYVARRCGLSAAQTAQELAGAIFQNPEPFLEGEPYDAMKHWELSSRYLGGNVSRKLARARLAEERFPGLFQENVRRLEAILPPRVSFDEIHLAPGASWVPTEEVAEFIASLLKLRTPPEVYFYKDLLTYKILASEEAKSGVLNTITYGVRSEDLGAPKQYLTALEILEQTMNAKTIKVFDYVPKRGLFSIEYEPVLNRSKTVEAQTKQRALLDAFRDFVSSDAARAARFEQYYNDSLVGYTYSRYDGSFLKLKDLNPEVRLYPHQRDAVARVLLSGSNLLLAHDVGTGKTYEMIVSVHELYRMGISKKNMIVVPNNVLKAMADTHKYLYPEDRILTVFPKDFTPKKRDGVLNSIRTGDYTAVYMAYSGFDLVVMSKEYYVEKMSREIRALEAAIYNCAVPHEKAKLTSRKEALSKKRSQYVLEEERCPYLTFDKLGIQTLVVDEAHNYKNIPIATRADGIVGMGGTSKKCREMLEKAHFVERLIFATGTPLTNSLADLFTFQTYLQPQTLEYHNLHTFDAWINTFGQRETTVECDVDSNSRSLRAMTRFTSFHNLGELMSLFCQVCDFHHTGKDGEGLPAFLGHEDVCVPKSRAQKNYVDSLSERTERIRTRQVKRTEDNLLKVTTDGRLAALDIRLTAPEDYRPWDGKSKTEVCADKVRELYLAHPDSVQIVFSDIGTPKEGFNVYDELKTALVRRGIPEGEVAFVHDATTEAARGELFAAMNRGTLRVVIGSTQKLGVGVNVQERLVALHHLSVPWRPADMVQREGRILRKGNTCPRIYMLRYVTEGSFDAYSWQLLENKQRFISSFLSGTSAARDMEDVADTVLSYAEVKALAIGNPLIKERVEVANLLERTKIACRSRQREISQLQSVVASLPEQMGRLKKLREAALRDHAYYKEKKEALPKEERLGFGEELLEALRDNAEKDSERLFCEFQGFLVMLPARMKAEDPHVFLVSPSGGRYDCSIAMEKKTALGCVMGVEYLLEHLGERADKLGARREELERQLSLAQADLRRENPYTEQVEAIAARLEEIDRRLEDKPA